MLHPFSWMTGPSPAMNGLGKHLNIVIEHVASPTPEAAALITELDEVLGAVYEAEQRHGLSVEQVFAPNVRFFVARIGGTAVGCGAVALFDAYAEVKRMYTREAARGQGVGKAILVRLAAEAGAEGKPMLYLETGIYQVAAIGLYEGFGFQRCGAFGHYAALEAHRIAASIFYKKSL